MFPYLAETYEIMPEGSREEVGKKIWDFYVSKAKGRNELFDQLTKVCMFCQIKSRSGGRGGEV